MLRSVQWLLVTDVSGQLCITYWRVKQSRLSVGTDLSNIFAEEKEEHEAKEKEEGEKAGGGEDDIRSW